MYQLKEKSEIIKEHISDHEFSLLRPYQQALYEPKVTLVHTFMREKQTKL